jgi:ABC-type nitrate/sulfonate/bicarbonate transport system permease component
MKVKLLMPIIFLGICVAIWQLTTGGGLISAWMLPAPGQVVTALIGSWELLVLHAIQTLWEAVAGFGLAIIVAILLAVLMILLPRVKEGLFPILVISQTIPIIAIYPLLIVWFGYGITPKILVVALVCFFPVVVNLMDGYEGADQDLAQWMQVMGASKWQVLWKLRMPAALPNFFSGLKVAATYSIMGAVIGEWMGASKGLGVFMTRSANSFMLDRVFAAILVITVLSIGLFGLIEVLARLMMPWHYKKLGEEME